MKLKLLFQALRRSSLASCVKQSPAWFLAPALVLGGGIAVAAHGYEPLVFDASQYQTETAQASELGDAVDAKAIEKKSKAKKAASATAANLAADTGSKASQLSAADFADGTYTGYARCAEDDIFDYYLKLSVVVKGGKVVAIKDVGGSSTGNAGSKQLAAYDHINDTYIEMARGSVTSQILKSAASGKAPSDIDAVSGATYSSNSILSAYLDALSKSAAKAGSKKAVAKPSKKNESKADEPAADEDGENKPADGSDVIVPGDADADAPQVDYGTGEFTAYALCRNTKLPSAYAPYYIGVTVKTLDGRVDSIVDIFGDDKGVVDPAYIYDSAENAYYLERALNGYGISGKHPGVKAQLETLIAGGKADGSIDTISGATYSSKSIVEAYRAALGMAAASAASAEPAEGTGEQGDTGETSSGTAAAALLGILPVENR